MGPFARVFFARGYPQLWSTSGIIRFVTRSDLAHVAIGDGNCVMDPSQRGDRFVPEMKYATLVPTLAFVVEVTLPRPIDWHNWQPSPSRHRLSFACVRVVKTVLARGGVVVPWHIVSPRGLFSHLVHQGAQVVTLE